MIPMFKSGNTDDLISLDQISEITLYLSIKLYTFIPVIPEQKTNELQHKTCFAIKLTN